MIIERTDGCILSGMDVDGIPISEMSEEQRQEVRKAFIEKETESKQLTLF